MRKILIVLFTISFLGLNAQNNLVNLNEAIKLGVENSRSLQMSKARADVGEAKYNELKYGQIPSVKLSASYTRLSDIEPFKIPVAGRSEPVVLFPVLVNSYNTRVSVSEPIFAGFRAKQLLQSGEFLEKALKLDYEKDKNEVILNIINAYYNLYKLNISTALLDENQKQIESHLKDIKNYEAAGLATKNDVLKVQIQLSNVELSKLDMQNSRDVVVYNLGIMLGKDRPTIDTTGIFSTHTLRELDFYQQEALNKRNEIKSADFRSKSAQSGVKIAKGNYYPLVTVGANYYYANPNPRVVPPKDQFTGTWDAGINLTYDLTGLYTNKHVLGEARAQAMEAQAGYEQLSDIVKMEVNQNYLACKQSQEKINLAKSTILQAEENYRIINIRFNEHVALLSDLLDANVALLQAKMNLSIAKADAEVAYSKLLKSSGILQ